MKIGVFGGSFNPIHNGHIQIVLEAIKILNLDRIIVVPVGVPSHRVDVIEGIHRCRMCKLAFEDFDVKDKIIISDIEVNSLETSYTYDTLLKLKEVYKDDEFYEIIGEDSANNFKIWRDNEKILEDSKVTVFKRKGDNNLKIDECLKEKMLILDTPYFEYSSTEIREKIIKKEKIDGLLPKKVIQYITQKNLYQGG